MNNRSYKQDYKKGAETCMIWSQQASDQMLKMVEQCLISDKNILQRINTNQSLAVKSGFIAEELSTETFNLDAMLKGKSVRAYTDQYKNTPLAGNDPVTDIVVTDNGQSVLIVSPIK